MTIRTVEETQQSTWFTFLQRKTIGIIWFRLRYGHISLYGLDRIHLRTVWFINTVENI